MNANTRTKKKLKENFISFSLILVSNHVNVKFFSQKKKN